MAERLIPQDKSIIVSTDIEPSEIAQLVQKTKDIEGISGYKVGITALGVGLNEVVRIIRENTDLPVIYDHQKAGNDIPEVGKKFAKMCKDANLDAVILYSFVGPTAEVAWIHASQDAGLHVMVGSEMTLPNFRFSEGGSIADAALDRIFRIGAEEGVRDFVLPGNKIEYVSYYRNLLDGILGRGRPTYYATGFVTQGGKISEFARVAGSKCHAIVGSAIYEAADMQKAAEEMVKQIK